MVLISTGLRVVAQENQPPIEVNSSFENIPVCESDTLQSETTIACDPTTQGKLLIGFNSHPFTENLQGA